MSVRDNRLSLKRRQCDERRRYLAGLESLAERLRADERRLRAEIQAAFADWQAPVADASPAGSARSLIERHGKLARSVATIDVQIVEARAGVSAAEQALKRQELETAQHAAAAGASQQRHPQSPPRAAGAVPPFAGSDRDS